MKKNIAIIVQCLYGGGAERIAGLLAKNLNKRYNVYLFLEDTSNIIYDYAGKIVDLSIEGKDYIEYYLRFYKGKYDIDCAISFLESANFMNIRTKGKECVIVSERCAQSPIRPCMYCQTAYIKMLYNYADRIVSVAHGVKYDLVNNYGVHEQLIQTIYNFIDKETIVEKSKEKIDNDILKFVGHSKVILNIGRMVQQKKQKKLITQFAKLIYEGEDVKLLIIGTGELEDELIKTSESLGVDKYIKIIKYNNNPFPIYKLATAIVMTSEYEGLPNVILEAMLLGVPVIATDCLAGPRELLMCSENYQETICGYMVCRNGILVERAPSDETGETEYFKEAMKYILHNDKMRSLIIHNAFNFMRAYNNQNILKKWIDVIENTVPSENRIAALVHPKIKQARKVIVYGAGYIGKQVMQQYLEKNYNPEFLCYAVSKKTEDMEYIGGIPVYCIDDVVVYKKEALVLIGVSDKYSGEIISLLNQYGFCNIQVPILRCMSPKDIGGGINKDAVSRV